MTLINLGSFEPDVADIGTDTLDVARNVIPKLDHSWGPHPDLLAVSSGALPAICRGIAYVQKTDGTYDTYLGTPSKLYKFDADALTFTDVSRLSGGDYAVPSDDFWSFAQFGHFLIAVNLGTAPQIIDIDSGTNFAALGGSPPIARFVTVMDNKVVLSCLSSDPREIAWSDIDDPEDWSTGLAGGQDFPDHGAVMGVFPHARVLLLERGVRSIISTGDTLSFEFPEMTHEKGTTAPYGIIELGAEIFWPSEDGFYTGNANGFVNISEGRVSRWFFNELNRQRMFQIYGTYDPYSARLLWAYPTGDAEYNDRILVYDRLIQSPYGPGRFSEISVDTYVLARLATAGVSLEGGFDSTDMDEAGLPSLDSRIYMGGAPTLAAVGTDLKLSTFDGTNLAATLETGTHMFGGMRRARVRSFEALIEGDDADQITVKVRKRKKFSEPWSTSSAISQQDSGRYPMNADGRQHRFEITIPAGTNWSHASAYDPDFVATSAR